MKKTTSRLPVLDGDVIRRLEEYLRGEASRGLPEASDTDPEEEDAVEAAMRFGSKRIPMVLLDDDGGLLADIGDDWFNVSSELGLARLPRRSAEPRFEDWETDYGTYRLDRALLH